MTLNYNKCISEKSGEQITFYIMSGDGLSCTDIDTVNNMIEKNPNLYIKEQVTVDTISVSDIFEKYFEKGPIVLNIDIEGMEYSILKQIDFDRYAPLVIVVERIEYSNSISDSKTGSEIDKLMSIFNDKLPEDLFNHAILESIYGLGLRVSECCNLKTNQVYIDEGFMKIIGKGDKERVIPIPSKTAELMKLYLYNIRPLWSKKANNNFFINRV